MASYSPSGSKGCGNDRVPKRVSQMSAHLRIGVLALALLALTSTSALAQITLEIRTITSVAPVANQPSQVVCMVNVKNAGQDPASNVEVRGELLGKKQIVSDNNILGQNESRDVRLEFNLPVDKLGSFPIFLMVGYEDPSGNRRSAAAIAIADTGMHTIADILVSAEPGLGSRWGEVRVAISGVTGINSVKVTCHVSDDLDVTTPTQHVRLASGKGNATFNLFNRNATQGNKYSIFLVTEFDRDGLHYLLSTSIQIPVQTEPTTASKSRSFGTMTWGERGMWLGMMTLLCFMATDTIAYLRRNRRLPSGSDHAGWVTRTYLFLDLIVLTALVFYVINSLGSTQSLAGRPFTWDNLVKVMIPNVLLTDTYTAGGDTGSHYYTLKYLSDYLIPNGKIGGWTPGNYAGFPILQFYFPLPFLIMYALGMLIKFSVAFKWVSILGAGLMPIGAYLMLRNLKTPFPGPILGAISTMVFLYNITLSAAPPPAFDSVWGGNILSNLAGEFSYGLSMALSLIFIGSLYRGCMDNKRMVLNAFLVFIVGFSHGYTLLFAEGISLYLLFTPHGFVRRLVYLAKVYTLGFCFLAFWLVPLLVYSKWTTPYHLAWTIYGFGDFLPNLFIPTLVIACASIGGLFGWGAFSKDEHAPGVLHALGYLLFGIAVSAVFYSAAPKLGVVDIRYIPYARVFLGLIAAMGLGWFCQSLRSIHLAWLPVPIVAILVLGWPVNMKWLLKEQPKGWIEPSLAITREWGNWNFSGFQGKDTWEQFERINKALRPEQIGTGFQMPRVVFEHSELHNRFGTSRAFESLPLFADRTTLEGLYMQASISAPFVFYIQSEVSYDKSCPFPQYNYAGMDHNRARRHLEIFNVRELIVCNPNSKKSLSEAKGYTKVPVEGIGQYEIWQLDPYPNSYVHILENEPILFESQDGQWKLNAYRWFTTDELLDRTLVFGPKITDKDRQFFKLSAKSTKEIPPPTPIDRTGCVVKRETINNEAIDLEFSSACIGKPALIKYSYHPNWHVEGAERSILHPPALCLSIQIVRTSVSGTARAGRNTSDPRLPLPAP